MELDINEENGRPVVAFYNKSNFRQSLNVAYLEDCLRIIHDNAFNPTVVPNASDPFLLSLNLMTMDTRLINNTASILRDVMRDRMLDSEYSYQRKNIPQEPICNLRNKIIIISGTNHTNTDMDELVNLSWSGSWLRRMTLTAVEETHDMEELKSYNMGNITLVIPDNETEFKNKGSDIAHVNGCQAVLVYYQSQDTNMETYLEKFQSSSFVLKPDALRFSQPTYPDPKPQIPQKKFNLIQVKTPLYTATI